MEPAATRGVGMSKSLLFLCYPNCSTCKRAQRFLDKAGVTYTLRNIKTDNPSAEELGRWHQLSGLPLRRFFNTSGIKYKELGLKDRLSEMDESKQLALLAADGMLVRRPLLIGKEFVLVGFREDQWQENLEP